MKIKDVAEKVGMSIASVSKALNGNSDLAPETVKMIRETAAKMGYIPNANARTLKTNRSYNIGVLFVDETNSGLKHEYFSGILNSLKDEAEKSGYDITFISNTIGKTSRTYYEHAKYRGCDGVIIACVDFKNPQVIELVESEIPTVTIDYMFDNRSSVISDNYTGMHDIVEYLSNMGHKKIAFIHGEKTSVTQKRIASFYRACALYGIEVRSDYVKEARYHIPRESGIATRELLALQDPPTCIIYPDDYSLLGGMTEIEKRGLRIPEDISIVGYDGIELSRLLRPRLTTYIQNTEQIGKLASQKIIEIINNPKTAISEQILVKGELQTGETVMALTGR